MIEQFKFLFSLKGNAKSCLYTEPLWGIPFNLYIPFATLYMYHLGVLDFQISIIFFTGRIVQVFFAIVGGIVTDKFGRRLTTLVGDILSWSVPALIWAFSQNFWWFLAAAIVNAMWHITAVSWECLWVDDTEESKIGPIFNWIYIAGLMAVFFAPISGYFVREYGVVPVVRVLYLITFVMMTFKFIILYIYSTETKRGKERMAAMKNVSMFRMLLGYRAVFKIIFKSRDMLRALTLQSILSAVLLVTSMFFALYATQNLGIPDSYLAYFPILRAVVMLVFLLVVQGWLNSKFKTRHMMLLGLGIYVAAMIWLLNSPYGSWMWIAVYVFMDACAAALLLPRLDTVVTNAIDPEERARIRSLFNMLILAVSSPFALFAGVLADMDRRLPFVLNLALFIMMAAVVLFSRNKKSAAV